MSKKGVSVISGSKSPVIGEKNIYNIVSWYPATSVLEQDPTKVTWELFKKRSSGKFTTTNNKKLGRSDFTFGESAAGHTYRLEAYRYRPEGGGLVITPQPAKIPKINKVELFYVDDTKGTTFSFMEKLRARANCVNMLGKQLIFTLWEDDAKGAGHNSKNSFIDSKPGRVNEHGIATVDFSLSIPLMMKASRGEQDSKLEFYVTVEYYKNKKHATNNVNVNNPYPQKPTPKQNPPASKSTTTKAKGSPAETKPASKKEEKEIWDSFTENASKKAGELWDWAESVGTAIKDKLPTFEKETGVSPTNIGKKEIPKKGEKCLCQQYDLIWGGHPNVDCAFRKKVVEICLDLWGEDNKIKMANNLMAVFRWESGGTFKPDVPNQANSGGTGLIQFMPSTAKGLLGKESTIEIVKNYFGKKYNKKTKQKEDWYLKRVKEFADMTAVEQLDYVKKYFEPLRGKTVEFVDFYLQVLFPVSSQKEDHIVFASSLDKLTTRTSETGKLRNLRVSAYNQNNGLDVNKDGKVWKSEIKTKVQIYLTEGLANKETDFECGIEKKKSTPATASKCPEDCSQCVDYSDVISIPKVNDQSGHKNHNRYNKEARTRANGTKYFHTGTDILAVVGTPIHSVMCGEVIHVRKDLPQDNYVKGYESASSYGNTITIKSKDANGNIVYVFYAHLSLPKVIAGQKVKHGGIIALSGSTGNAMHVDVKYRHVHVEAGTSYTLYGGTTGKLKCKLTGRLNPEDYMKTKFDDKGN